MRNLSITALVAAFLPAVFLPEGALAHSGDGDVSGFHSGLMHPLGGGDHLLVLLAVGLIAALGGRAMVRAMPLGFLGMMLVGAALGMAGVRLPGAEVWIIASVIVLGLVLTLPSGQIPPRFLLAGTAVFGLFHGYAHGVDLPVVPAVAGHLLGFTLATAALLGLGLVIGARLPALSARVAGMAIRLMGISLAGINLVAT